MLQKIIRDFHYMCLPFICGLKTSKQYSNCIWWNVGCTSLQ